MIIKIIILFILSNYINSTTYTHTIVLNDENTTVDGSAISSDNSSDVYIQDGENIIHYESEYANETGYGDSTDSSEWHSTEDCNKEKLITIQVSGTYLISGTLTGQWAISGSSSDKFVLYFNGANITCNVAPAVIFYTANEIDSTEYEDTSTTISYDTAAALNFTDAGAKVIIMDGSVNYIEGSHVAKCYKYTVDENNTRTYTTSKRAKYDGAFYSKVSMSVEGETNQSGLLYITADNEGLNTEKHLLINGPKIYISSQDDGINTNEEGGSVTLIKDWTIQINGGLGSEGDGIDSNGYLIITGGTIITAGKPAADSGMDADNGVVINGGNVIAVGSSMDGASSSSEQYSMNLQFSSTVSSSSVLVIKDSDSNEIVNFSPSSVDLFSQTSAREYSGCVVSNSNFAKSSYYLYVDGTQYCYGSTGGQGMGGGPGNSQSSSSATNTAFTLSSTVTTFSNIQKCSSGSSTTTTTTTSSNSSSTSSSSTSGTNFMKYSFMNLYLLVLIIFLIHS